MHVLKDNLMVRTMGSFDYFGERALLPPEADEEGDNDNNGNISAEECNRWDTHFKLERSEVEEYVARYATDPTYEIPNSIINWPAHGDPSQGQDEFLAPFFDLNGNGITVANSIWDQMKENDPKLDTSKPKHPITADSLKPIVQEKLDNGEKLQMGMVFPVSTHNYELRYWLASAGIHPGMYTKNDIGGRTDAEVELSVTPPPMMPATLEAGNIQGYCVGEPWNQQAVAKNIGVPVTTNYDIWKNNPEKVFGVTKEWADENPNTHLAVIKALIRAGQWLDATKKKGIFRRGLDLVNREEAARILSQPNYVGADYEVIKNSMTGFFYFQKSDKREMPDFNVFYRYYCTYPWYSDGIWFLTQMRRWGQITEPKSDEWYHKTAKEVYRPDIYLKAAKMLLDEGVIDKNDIPWDTDGYKPPTSDFIDGIEYNGKKPLEYLKGHKIGHKN